MQNTNAEIKRFLTACDELLGGKFILADRKIGEVLKAVAASEELTMLFSAVTDGFDFAAAKTEYLKNAENGGRGIVYLPTDRREVLAFVFCLLAEFDGGVMKFNDFLLHYFYEDGSYTASYSLFVDRMIRPFRDIVRDCYPLAEKVGTTRLILNKEDDVLKLLGEKVSLERTRIQSLALSEEDKIAGDKMLAELYAAVGRKDIAEIKALLCGYVYYLNAVNGNAENSKEIFALAGELQ